MKTFVINFSVSGTLYVEAESETDAKLRFDDGEFAEEIGMQLSQNAYMAEADSIEPYDDE